MEAVVKRFKTDLHNCVGYIQDPKMLKESIKALYQKHVQEDIVCILFCFISRKCAIGCIQAAKKFKPLNGPKISC